MSRIDALIQEIRDIADNAMVQREFQYSGSLYRMSIKKKVKFRSEITKGK